MKYTSLLFLLIISSGYCQTLKVADGDTKETIPFATVLLIENGKTVSGGYCDGNGAVTLAHDQNFDTVTFSCIGYKDKTIVRNSLADTVYLDKSVYELKEVVISNEKQKDTILGEFNAKRKGYFGFSAQSQYAVFFENNIGNEIFLKSFLFKVISTDYKTVLRIHICKKKEYTQTYALKNDAAGIKHSYESIIPGDDIINDNIIVYLEPGTKGIVETDFTDYNIALPKEGVFMVIECLGYYDASGNFTDRAPKFTKIEKHVTRADNFCIRYDLLNNLWVNINKSTKIDYEKVFKTKTPEKSLVAPTFGLKVVKTEN